ncbi:MAG: NUDIX hydrolase [Hyperionvirus sp.]|uniref:NUDIX hydrolase n=1 Tax=Hyperionvirus sp. TaxID=2487770 RepID=A0A3G5A9J6_9VIRU|nr:MAG: NUDIX hydrolase [Hyperionvirus sp.]
MYKNKYHKYKSKYVKLKANKPITSYGIILVKLGNPVQFLMIRRRETFGYTDFVRGRYQPTNTNQISTLFQEMTAAEHDKIKNWDFDMLWNDKWAHNDKKYLPNIKKEYTISKEKFNNLNLKYYLDNIKPKYTEGEWGFPKGRCDSHEATVSCALREFTEETGITPDEIKLLSQIEPLVETKIGSDNKIYKYTYYTAQLISNIEPTITTKSQKSEIDAIKFFSYKDAYQLIRPEDIDKKNILTRLHEQLKRL